MSLLVATVLTIILLFDSFPLGQERCHWFILILIRVRVTNFDINDGFKWAIPQTLDHQGPPHLFVLVTSLTYLLL